MPARSPEALAHKRERDRERDRERRASGARPRRTERTFIAIDGEAVKHEGRGIAYCCLCASSGERLTDRNALPLDSGSMLAWLLSLRVRHPHAQLVYFWGDYDVNHWLCDLPWSAIQSVYSGALTDWTAPNGITYALRYVPGKYLELGQRAGDRLSPWVRIDDVRGWIDGPLLAGIDQWGIDLDAATLATVTSWKRRRQDFRPADLPAIADYCAAECRILAAIMARVRDALGCLELRPAQWHGPGRAAGDLMRRHGVPDHLATLPPAIDAATLASYYGGRIQATMIGLIGEAIQYDLNSAYAWALSQVPTMRGRWQHRKRWFPHRWGVWRVRWELPAGAPLAPFPFRGTGGSIYWPRNGEGWYWTPEIVAAIALHGAAIQPVEGYEFTPADDSRPFAWLADVYRYRKIVQGRSPQVARAAKLVMVACYGKTVQGSSFRDHRPKLQSLMWGGLATALVRARVLDACRRDPSAIAVIQTDSLVSTAPLPLDTGPGFGQWREVAAGDTFVLSSGVFEMRNGEDGHARSKVRGVAFAAAKRVEWDVLRWMWKRDGWQLDYRVDLRLFVGMGVAIARNRPQFWRSWLTRPFRVSTAPVRSDPRPIGEYAWRLLPAPLAKLADNDISRSYIAKGGGSPYDPLSIDERTDQLWESEQPAPVLL